MKITLNNYGLKSLEYGLGVFKKVVRTKKETDEKYEDEEVVGYYGDLGSGIAGLLKYETNSSLATDLKALKEDYERTKKRIFEEVKKCKLS